MDSSRLPGKDRTNLGGVITDRDHPVEVLFQIAIQYIVLFSVLIFASVVYLYPDISPTDPKAPIVTFFEIINRVGIVGGIIGLIKYRLLKDRFFWMLWIIIVGALAVHAGLDAWMIMLAPMLAVLALVFVVPLWQLKG